MARKKYFRLISASVAMAFVLSPVGYFRSIAAAKLDCHHSKHRDLCRERLCACNADFRTDVQIYARIGGAGNR